MQQAVTGRLHNRRAVVTFGALQVAFGILLILLNILEFVVDGQRCFAEASAHTVAGSGFWAGSFFILTGSFGIVAGESIPPNGQPRMRRSHLITSLALSFLGILITIIMIPLSVAAVTRDPWPVHVPKPPLALGLHIGPNAVIAQAGPHLAVANTVPQMVIAHIGPQVAAAHIGPQVAIVQTIIFSILLIICLGQLVSASVNIRKLPPRTALITYSYSMPTGIGAAAARPGVASAVHTHPDVVVEKAIADQEPQKRTEL